MMVQTNVGYVVNRVLDSINQNVRRHRCHDRDQMSSSCQRNVELQSEMEARGMDVYVECRKMYVDET